MHCAIISALREPRSGEGDPQKTRGLPVATVPLDAAFGTDPPADSDRPHGLIPSSSPDP
jgi:hypothetical protein